MCKFFSNCVKSSRLFKRARKRVKVSLLLIRSTIYVCKHFEHICSGSLIAALNNGESKRT